MMIISCLIRGKGCHMQELSKRKKEIAKKYQHQEKRKAIPMEDQEFKRKKMHGRPMIDCTMLLRI